MILDVKIMLAGEFTLALFDDFVIKLNNLAGFDANHVVVMFLSGEFKHGLPTFKMVAIHQTSRFKLGQYTINRGEANFFTIADERLVNVFGAEVVFMGIA